MPAVLRLCVVSPTMVGSTHLSAVPEDGEVMDRYEEYEPWLRANSCSAATIEGRIRVLGMFARANPTFPDCTAGQITGWIGRPGYSAWTRSTYYNHVRSFYRFAIETDLIGTDPMARMRRPKPGKCKPRPLTVAQVDAVMAAASPNVHAWMTLGLYAGLRASEIAKIRADDIEQDQLWVVGKGGVGVYLPTHPAIWALALSRPRTGYLFPSWSTSGHVTTRAVSAMTSALFDAYGIEGSIHRMRHTFASRLLRAGVNVRIVQELMRHKSLASTMLYTEVTRVEMLDGILMLAA